MGLEIGPAPQPSVEKLEEYKMLTKWAPILDVLEIKDENVRAFVALYAEHHHDNFLLEERPLLQDMDKKEQVNLLPVSLKLLSMLNLTGKNLLIKDRKDVELKRVNIKVDKMEVMEYSRYGLDIIVRVESMLLNKLAEEINMELEGSKNFYVNHMVSDICLYQDEYINPVITMTSECKVE